MSEELQPLNQRDRRTMFFILFSVLSSAWVLTKEPAEIYGAYLVFFSLLPVFISRYGIPPYFWMFFMYFLVTGVFNMVVGNNVPEQFFKIFLGVMLSYLFYYYVLERFEFDAGLIFKYYLKAAWIVTMIGAIQLVSFFLHFKQGYDFRWLPIFNKWAFMPGGNLGIRINSIFGEPSQYAAVMAPALFVAVYNLIRFRNFVYKRWQSILVVFVYLMTFSSLGYVGILFILVMLLLNFGLARYLLFFIPVMIGAFLYLYNTVPDFQYRWDSTLHLFQTGEVDIRTEHGSSIVFYNNFVVATENFKSNFLLGTGLGSHPVAFEKYSITKNIETFGFANNSSDANSMMLRIISECGLIGVLFVIVFLRRNFVKRNRGNADEQFWIISNASLCVIVLYLFRQGHYFINGFPIFVWIYYYNKRNYEQWKSRMLTGDEMEDEEADQPDELTQPANPVA